MQKEISNQCVMHTALFTNVSSLERKSKRLGKLLLRHFIFFLLFFVFMLPNFYSR